MIQVIPILFAAALGFALGCKYKDCLCKKKSSKVTDVDFVPSFGNHSIATPKVERENFSLKAISDIFMRYNTPLNSSNSFPLLLDSIEEISYISLMKNIASKVNSPKSLYDFLNSESLNVFEFKINNGLSEPFISDEDLNAILQSNNIDTSMLTNVAQKVEFLLTLYQGKGTKRFQESFGDDLSNFISRYNSKENIETLYEGIMSTIQKRLDFLS